MPAEGKRSKMENSSCRVTPAASVLYNSAAWLSWTLLNKVGIFCTMRALENLVKYFASFSKTRTLSLWSCERCTLRELIARPSASRTISEPIISTAKSRSRTWQKNRIASYRKYLKHLWSRLAETRYIYGNTVETKHQSRHCSNKFNT